MIIGSYCISNDDGGPRRSERSGSVILLRKTGLGECVRDEDSAPVLYDTVVMGVIHRRVRVTVLVRKIVEYSGVTAAFGIE